MKNGEAFASYEHRVDVPSSKFAFDRQDHSCSRDYARKGGPLMNRFLLAGLLSLLLGAAGPSAQDSKPGDTIPAPSNNRGAAYPRIMPTCE